MASEEERARAKAKAVMSRKGQRGAAERKAKEGEALLGTEDPDLGKLRQIGATLEERIETLRQLDSEVQLYISDEAELVEDICESDGFRENIGIVLQKICEIMKGADTMGSSLETLPTREAAGHSVRGVKLPRLQLKSFDGDLTQWTPFWDSYQSAVHNNKEVSDIQKFTYLKSLLEKSAKEAVAGMTLSSANYKQAIEVLKRRFGNKDKIINCHMEALVAMEGVQRDNKVEPIRKLYDRIETHIRSLRALGVETETYGSLLCPILVKKLPPELKLNVSRKLPGEDWNVEGIMKIILEEVEARERTEGIQRGSGSTEVRSNRTKELHTGATLLSGSENYCCYCRLAGHLPQTCRKVTKPEKRKRILQQGGPMLHLLKERACK